MNHPRAKLFTTVALAGVLSLPAFASEPATAPPAEAIPAPEQQQPVDVSDEKLRQFAKAAKDVQKIQEDYAAKAQSLQKTTEEQIVSSVQDAGMSVAEFTELVALVQNDPDLAERLSDLQ